MTNPDGRGSRGPDSPLPLGPVIAIETSGDVGSVAIAVDGVVVAHRFLRRRSAHGTHVMHAVEGVLTDVGLRRTDVTAVVVGSGPGSFTGVRIAGATAKGLAGGLGVPLFAGSSLAAAAVASEILSPDDPDLPAELMAGSGVGGWPRRLKEGEREIRYVLLDARRGRVYGGCYEVIFGSRPVALVPPHGGTVTQVLNRRSPLGTVFAGPGATVHGALIRAAGYGVLHPPAGIPTADGVLAACSWTPVDLGAWEPDYVREWTPGAGA